MNYPSSTWRFITFACRGFTLATPLCFHDKTRLESVISRQQVLSNTSRA